MSIEIFVLSDHRLNSLEDWQNALNNEGFPLKLDHSRPFAELSGYLHAKHEGREAGFECDHFDAVEILETYSNFDLKRQWKCCLAFRFGGDFLALWGAFAAATAYARATGGIVFDTESGDVLTPDDAKKLTLSFVQHLTDS